MSDTNSNNGNKKDTGKIQFIKVGDKGKESSLNIQHEPFRIEDSETGITSERLKQNLETGLEAEIGELKSKIEALSQPGSANKKVNEVNLLKKYISLKEAEVRDIREQHNQYQVFMRKLSSHLEELASRNRELLTELDSSKRREETLRKDLSSMKEKYDAEFSLQKNDYEEKINRIGDIRAEHNQLEQKREEWKDKVKEDLKRIKLKERELENKYELLKRDTQALLDSKDRHVLELKKKNDALELEMESFEEKLKALNTVLGEVSSKKRRLLDTMRLVTALLENIDAETKQDLEDRKAG